MDQPQPAITVFNKHAELYRQKYMDVSAYSEGLDAFCDALPPGVARILDIGCGPGNLTRYLRTKNSFFSILGIDGADNMVAIAKAENPDSVFLQMKCEEIRDLGLNFDGMVCGFVLPYLDPEAVKQLIKDATGKLVPGGCLLISFMDAVETFAMLHTGSAGDTLEMYKYAEQDVVYHFLKNDCTIIGRWQHNNTDEKGKKVSELILLAKKAGPEL